MSAWMHYATAQSKGLTLQARAAASRDLSDAWKALPAEERAVRRCCAAAARGAHARVVRGLAQKYDALAAASRATYDAAMKAYGTAATKVRLPRSRAT
jgi:hypothetical protein